ncbi:MAG: nucleotidyltransferase [Bacilli bacterium]
MKFTDEQLKLYATPLSVSENQKCLNTIGMVRDALKELGFTDDGKQFKKMYDDTFDYSLNMRSLKEHRKVKIFIQGSYANNTNVRTESDVDIAVVQEEFFNTENCSSRLNLQVDRDYNYSSSTPSSKTFKDEVQECLVNKFGNNVERKNKYIKVNGNAYIKDADIVPCRAYRNSVTGILITPDIGEIIINYPEQHIENGKKKNEDTNFYYKKMVRIIKKIRYLMEENGYSEASEVSSFGLESLLWNLPDAVFTNYSNYKFEFKVIVNYLYNHKSYIGNYKEANGINKLVPSLQDVHKYESFIDKLKEFYNYDIKENA